MILLIFLRLGFDADGVQIKSAACEASSLLIVSPLRSLGEEIDHVLAQYYMTLDPSNDWYMYPASPIQLWDSPIDVVSQENNELIV